MIRPTSSPIFPKPLISLEKASFVAFTPACESEYVSGGKSEVYVHNPVFKREKYRNVMVVSGLTMWKRLVTDLGVKWATW